MEIPTLDISFLYVSNTSLLFFNELWKSAYFSVYMFLIKMLCRSNQNKSATIMRILYETYNCSFSICSRPCMSMISFFAFNRSSSVASFSLFAWKEKTIKWWTMWPFAKSIHLSPWSYFNKISRSIVDSILILANLASFNWVLKLICSFVFINCFSRISYCSARYLNLKKFERR